jgi:cell division protein ZapE
MNGPASIYQRGLDSGEIQFDESQNQALIHLQRLYDDLTRVVQPRGFLSRMFGSRSDMPVQGLYLWGGVGRGKTYLMDVFYESLPFEEKRRLHFHRFMRMVHRELHQLQGTSDPLKQVASNLANQTRVLCFDEFFVSDITDAMILANLLDEMFARGTVLVATSNVVPANLYQNGLQRRKFLPAIALIEKHTQVFNLDGSRDYRLRALQHAEIYHSPLDEAAEVNLSESFTALAPDVGEFDVALDIENRFINTRRCADGVVWFTFDALCDGPRSQNDYIELAKLFQTVLISGVPRLTADQDSQARRFISLVDEFYDRNVKLIMSAAVPIEQLYAGTLLEFEFRRTESRLQEMQSQEFLSREHRP